MPITQRPGAVEENQVGIALHSQVLESVVEDDDFRVQLLHGQLNAQGPFAGNDHKGFGIAPRQQVRFVSAYLRADDGSLALADDLRRFAAAAAVAAADDGHLSALLQEMPGHGIDRRRLARAAGSQVADRDDRHRCPEGAKNPRPVAANAQPGDHAVDPAEGNEQDREQPFSGIEVLAGAQAPVQRRQAAHPCSSTMLRITSRVLAVAPACSSIRACPLTPIVSRICGLSSN